MIATVRWYEGEPVGDGYCRGWFDGVKSVLAAAIGRGTFTEGQGTRLLIDRFRAQWSHSQECHVCLSNG